MYISAVDVETAVLGVFADLRIPAGGRLSFSTLVKVWPRKHLRHSDLHQAVQRMARVGFVVTEDSAEGMIVVLSERGYARAAELTAAEPRNLLRRMRFALLPLLRVFEQPPAPQAPRRRLADRVAPQI